MLFPNSFRSSTFVEMIEKEALVLCEVMGQSYLCCRVPKYSTWYDCLKYLEEAQGVFFYEVSRGLYAVGVDASIWQSFKRCLLDKEVCNKELAKQTFSLLFHEQARRPLEKLRYMKDSCDMVNCELTIMSIFVVFGGQLESVRSTWSYMDFKKARYFEGMIKFITAQFEEAYPDAETRQARARMKRTITSHKKR